MPIGPLHSGPASNFPSKDQWKDFDHIFDVNKNECHVAGDTDSDVAHIKQACLTAGKDHNIEPRIIFCIIMQESKPFYSAALSIPPSWMLLGDSILIRFRH